MARDLTFGGSFLDHSVFESVGFVRTSHATDVPDLQLHALPWTYPSPNQDEPVRHMPDPRPGLTVFSTLIYPKSRGTLRLASADPTAAPLIDYGFFTDPNDVEVLAEGTEMIREIMASAAFGGGVKAEIHPGPGIPNGPEPAARAARALDVGLPRRRHLPDGRGRPCGRRPGPEGPRHRGPARRRRLDHAEHHRRQHQRAVLHDRREGRRA
ncbi:hypothetical protein G5V59_11470 [Nocardioides sp. W3-2-3]|nr:hypothetical protein [Nocardioides convexus]